MGMNVMKEILESSVAELSDMDRINCLLINAEALKYKQGIDKQHVKISVPITDTVEYTYIIELQYLTK